MRFSGWRSWFGGGPRWDEAVIWALDLETTGLRPDTDHIISVGMVPIRAGVIRYGERWHQLIRPTGVATVPTDGIRAHHILPADLDQAPPIGEVLPHVDGFEKACCSCTMPILIFGFFAGNSDGTIVRGRSRS